MFFKVGRSALFTVFASVNLADIPVSVGIPAPARTLVAWGSLSSATLFSRSFLATDSGVGLGEDLAVSSGFGEG